MTGNGFKLRRPCAKCPFRTDVPGYLRRERARGIAADVAAGAPFYCHETTVEDGDDGDLVAGPNSQVCAGSLIALERDGVGSNFTRVAERLGQFDVGRLDMDAPVVRSLAQFVEHHGEEEVDAESCCVADEGCLAPAGFLVGGHVVPAEPEGELGECPACGQPVCANCSNDAGECVYCLA